MSCPNREALYRHPWPGQSAEDKRALREHSRGCAECAAAVVRLESARRVLAAEAPQFAPFREAATWRAIEAATARPPRTRRRLLPIAGAAIAAAAVLFAVARPSPTDGYVLAEGAIEAAGAPVEGAVPMGEALAVTRAAVIEADDLSLAAAAGARLRLESREFVRLDQGGLEVQVESAARRLRVRTPHADLAALGARVDIEVGGRTAVRVRRGQLTVTPDGGPALELGPGQDWTSPDPSPTARAAPPARAELARARALVKHDAAGARRIAGAVLERDIAGPDEVDALAVIADAHRRSGQSRQAAKFYGRVAAHPAGGGYAEEALLRRARMLMAAGDPSGALEALAEARRRFAAGVLEPERCAVRAQVWLTRGEPRRAADLVQGCAIEAHAVQDVRRDIARALSAEDPARARQLTRDLEE